MSSSEAETSILRVSPGSPVHELIKYIRYSFRECEYDEVQKILMDRENKMNMEMENLVMDRDSLKKEVHLLEKRLGMAELENSKLEEKLKTSQIKCEELNEKVMRLIEEKRVSSDREKEAKVRFDKACEENDKMASEKDKIIVELNEKINELNNKNLETELLLRESRENFQSWVTRLAKMEEEVEDLKHEKLAAKKIIDELKVEKLESDKAAEVNKKGFEDSELVVMKLKKKLASLLNVEVKDIPSTVDELDKFPCGEEGANVNSQDLMGEKDILGNGDAVNVAIMPPGVRSTCNVSENEPEKGGINHDGANSVETSPDAESVSNHPQMETNASDQENGSKRLQASGDIIDLCDSDDEKNPGKAAYISDICANVGENETNKRKRGDCNKGSPISPTSKRKRSLCINDDDINMPMEQVLELDSDDESCSDSDLINLLAKIRKKKS